MKILRAIRSWLKWTLCDLVFRLIPRHPAHRQQTLFGVNLIGYAHAEMGLGEVLRNTALALESAHIPFLVRKLDVPLLNRQENLLMQPFIEDTCQYPVNFIGINPDLIYRLPQWLDYEEWGRRYNVAYWFWELANFPSQWRYACRLVDEIWVNTEFVANAVRQFHTRVYKIPFAVEFVLPEGAANRSRFGLREDDFTFLFSYDFNSSAVRKNPRAVLEAFRTAFPLGTEAVALVVKSINGEQNPTALASLKGELKGDRRVIWVDDYLSTEEMRQLLSLADVYVSLHRSEGLGLGMAESMYLGKPVIATNYSGNVDFMNEDNACMVPYRLIPVGEGEYWFPRGQVWADPDIEAAAAWMQKLSNDPALCSRIGASAAAYMRSHHSMARVAQSLFDRLEVLRIEHFP